MSDWGWWQNARCVNVTIGGVPFDEVERKRDVNRARAVCDMCPVRQACLDEAVRLESQVGRGFRHGFRGGLTRRQRASLIREYAA